LLALRGGGDFFVGHAVEAKNRFALFLTALTKFAEVLKAIAVAIAYRPFPSRVLLNCIKLLYGDEIPKAK
jgi:hypothetical protein